MVPFTNNTIYLYHRPQSPEQILFILGVSKYYALYETNLFLNSFEDLEVKSWLEKDEDDTHFESFLQKKCILSTPYCQEYLHFEY